MSVGEHTSYLFLANGRAFVSEADEIRELDRVERAAALLLFEEAVRLEPIPTPAES